MRPYMVVVAIAVPIAIVLVLAVADVGDPDYCAISGDLETARMLDEASEVADRDDCTYAQIQAKRERASGFYGRADAFAATGKAARTAAEAARAEAKAAGTDTKAVEAAKLRATAADLRAERADYNQLGDLVVAVSVDPFRPKRLAMLDELLGRMPEQLAPDRAAAACGRAYTLARRGLPDQASLLIGLAAPTDRCTPASAAVDDAHAAALHASRAAEAQRDENSDEARHQDALALQADAALTASQAALTAAAADDDDWVDDAVDWIAGIPGWLEEWWQELVIVALALLLLATLAFRALQHESQTRAGLRKWLLGPGGGSRIGRRIARLHWKLGDFAGGKEGELDGKDLATQVGSALAPPTGRGAFPFDRLPAASVEDQTVQQLATFLKTVPHGDLLAGVLNLLPAAFPRRTAVVDARLLPTDGRSAGLSVSIDAPDGARDQKILRELQIDPEPTGTAPAQQARLIAPASIWVRHRLTALAGEERHPDNAVEAEMLTAAGAEWFAVQDFNRAATCYARALDRDPELLTAQNNLAVTEIRMGAHAAAVERLEQLYARLEPFPAPIDEKWPALREAVQYNLALALVYAP